MFTADQVYSTEVQPEFWTGIFSLETFVRQVNMTMIVLENNYFHDKFNAAQQ